MNPNPKDRVTNVLYNKQAMEILEDACTRLKALGLHCYLGPDAMFPESEMSAALRVSTSAEAIDQTIVGSLVVSDFTDSAAGRKRFDARLSEFRADCAIGKAMHNPRAGSA